MNATLGIIGAALVAVLVAFFRGIVTGARKERAKQAAKDAKATEERLEMHREATAAERQAAGMTDEEARKEGMEWSKPR